jgi:WD40 repeat protein
MRKLSTTFFLLTIVGLLVSSCRAGQTIDTATAVQTVSTLTPTGFPSLEVTPAKTDTPPIQPACFETYLAPVAFMPDNSRVVVRAEKGVQVFDLEKQEEENFLASPTNLNGPVVTLSQDGSTLAWALDDNSIQLVRISDKKVLHTLAGHTSPITKLRFSPSGDALFSASHDGSVIMWSNDGQQIHAFQPGNGEVLGIGISADGEILATLPFDGPVKLWNIKEFQAVTDVGGTGGNETSDVAFSIDDQFIAADLATGLTVWEASDQKQLLSGINSMAFAFSPTQNILAYSDIGDNNAIVLISPDGKQTIAKLEGSQSPNWEMIFSPDGSLLASADGLEIRIWRVADDKLLYIGKSECP